MKAVGDGDEGPRPTNEGKGSDLHAVGDDLRPWPERT